jgi:hypothetical protein
VQFFTVRKRAVPVALLHMATDRFAFRTAAGLRFVKSLGTSSGTTFMPHDADLHVWALLTVWDSPAASDHFESTHRVPRSWRDMSVETARFGLEPVRWRGEWSGQEPFGPRGGARRSDDPSMPGGPVAALTRARVRTRKIVPFLRAVPPVAADVTGGSTASEGDGAGNRSGDPGGSLLRIGIGEAPIGLQATFSVWTDHAAIDQFAYQRAPHRQVIRETVKQDWYAEEMFVRFAVKSATGTVRGASMEPIQRLVRPPITG